MKEPVTKFSFPFAHHVIRFLSSYVVAFARFFCTRLLASFSVQYEYERNEYGYDTVHQKELTHETIYDNTRAKQLNRKTKRERVCQNWSFLYGKDITRKETDLYSGNNIYISLYLQIKLRAVKSLRSIMHPFHSVVGSVSLSFCELYWRHLRSRRWTEDHSSLGCGSCTKVKT